ncbi:MAG: DUF3604 domain-containing protein [Planctomycetes bacterium]|nr:DUF3604 domain-containing protein [Planctomycetota bacterium]
MNVEILPDRADPDVPADLRMIFSASSKSLPAGTHILVHLPAGLEGYEVKKTEATSVVIVGFPKLIRMDEIAGQNVRTHVAECGPDLSVLEFILEADLPANGSFLILIPSVRFRRRAGRYAGDVFVRLPGGDFAPAGSAISLESLPGRAESIQVYATAASPDGKPAVTIAAEGPAVRHYMPDAGYRGTVEIKLPGRTIRHAFTKADAGLFRFEGDPLPAGQTVRIEARDEANGWRAMSEPVSAAFAPPGFKIFFGDMHLHSNFSDGLGDPGEILAMARDWKRLDFIALNEHVENGLAWREWTGEKWAAMTDNYERFYEPGRFVTIGGFEFRSYTNLFCFNREYAEFPAPDFFPWIEKTDAEIQKRIAELTKRENWLTGYHRLEEMRETCMPVPVHLLQVAHGNRPPEIGSELFLARGDRVGFFGGTDSHFGVPAQVEPGLARNGQAALTGVIAKELTREGLFEALRNRRCYATMGTRHLVHFELDGHLMGEDILIDRTAPRRIAMRIAGNEEIDTIEIVRGGRTVKTFRLGKAETEIEFVDSDAIADGTYYFSRTALRDGRKIWTSPVWVRVREDA